VRPGRAADHSPPSSAGHGRVELYLYPPSGPHRACNGITLSILMNLEFPRQFFNITPIYVFMKIRPVGAELFQADRRKDRRTDGHDEASSRFSPFCELAQKFLSVPHILNLHILLRLFCFTVGDS